MRGDGPVSVKSGRREKCFEKARYLGELVHCGAGIPGAQREVVGVRRLIVEAAETFTATRTVGDAQVSEVRYDVRHDGSVANEKTGPLREGVHNQTTWLLLSQVRLLGTVKAAHLAFTPKNLLGIIDLLTPWKDKCVMPSNTIQKTSWFKLCGSWKF